MARDGVKRPRNILIKDLDETKGTLPHRHAIVKVDQPLGVGPGLNRGRTEQTGGSHAHCDGVGDGHNSAEEPQAVVDVQRLRDVDGIGLDGHVRRL